MFGRPCCWYVGRVCRWVQRYHSQARSCVFSALYDYFSIVSQFDMDFGEYDFTACITECDNRYE